MWALLKKKKFLSQTLKILGELRDCAADIGGEGGTWRTIAKLISGPSTWKWPWDVLICFLTSSLC